MTSVLGYTPTWPGQGSCYGRPDLLYPHTPDELEHAARLCGDCPVLAQCRTWVLAIPPHLAPDGVVAGLTVFDRDRLALSSEPPKRCGDCGQVRPLWEFPLSSPVSPARRTICRACVGARNTRSSRSSRARRRVAA